MVYLDNILIYSRDFIKYKSYIFQIIKKLYKYKFYIKLSKYKFNKRQIEFLKFIINCDEIYLDPERV